MNDPQFFPMPFDVTAQAIAVARRAEANRCSGDLPDPTISLLRYIVGLLTEVGEAYDNEYIDAADLRRALTVIADEIDAEIRR